MEIALVNPAEPQDADVCLIRAMASGEERALRAVYTAYGQRMLAYAIRLTGDRSVAEEVLQDSLLAAWRAAAKYRGEGRVLTWLLGIVHHQALNALRRKQLPTAALTEACAVADGAPRPEEEAAARDQQRMLGQALGSLPPEQRAALTLVFYHGLSLAEVAEVCNCPLGTVKSRLSYAKAQLRKALSANGLGAEDQL